MEISVTLNLLSLLLLDLRNATMTLTIGDGATIDDVIDLVDRENPGFRAAMLAADGTLSREFVFFINGTNILHLGGLETPVRVGDAVNVIPAIAGG